MNFKQTFLDLTEWTIPYGYEQTLEKYLPNGILKDSVGNYYIQIGESETLFTTHLDTYSKERVKVNHIIKGDKIYTDKKSILGGDNKLGCTILLYMIEQRIPGTYYFFIGEEPLISGGRFGSINALKSNPTFFKKFKRAVAFDRKMTGSVVTRQLARRCCSDEFAESLSDMLNLDFSPDSKAYYTDTATFIDTIPECTNISAGGWNEHTVEEWVDLSYTKKVAEAACKLDWETLPVSREVKDYEVRVKKFNTFNNKVVNNIKVILDKYNHLHTNELEYETGNSDNLNFNTWFDDTNVNVRVEGKNIILNIGEGDIKFNNTSDMDVYLSFIFGVQLDLYSIDDLIISEDGVEFEEEFLDWKSYMDMFHYINKSDTSYIWKGLDEQYTDETGQVLNKEQFIFWVKENIGY